MHLSVEDRIKFKNDFLHELIKLSEIMPLKQNENEINEQFEKVLAILDKFSLDILPYSTASEFIYEINDEGVEHFFEYLEELIEKKYKTNDKDDLYIKAIKLLEHLELANSQKAHLYKKQEQKLNNLNSSLLEFEIEIKEKSDEFKAVKDEISSYNKYLDEYEGKINSFEDKFKHTEKATEQITVNLISILGIFAAILLGAYGSIQGFSNIFANANKIGIGKILMLSSVGASAVLLILFFLLSSIARMTEKGFGNGGSSFITKHPIMFFSHCILLIIFTTGGVIELIKNEITIEKNWLWILLIIIVVVHVLFIYRTKSMWGILKYFQKNTKEAFKKAIVFMIFVIMFIIILAYHFEYINY